MTEFFVVANLLRAYMKVKNNGMIINIHIIQSNTRYPAYVFKFHRDDEKIASMGRQYNNSFHTYVRIVCLHVSASEWQRTIRTTLLHTIFKNDIVCVLFTNNIIYYYYACIAITWITAHTNKSLSQLREQIIVNAKMKWNKSGKITALTKKISVIVKEWEMTKYYNAVAEITHDHDIVYFEMYRFDALNYTRMYSYLIFLFLFGWLIGDVVICNSIQKNEKDISCTWNLRIFLIA